MPESVHIGDPAGGYVEMLKARNSARGHLMAWSEKRAGISAESAISAGISAGISERAYGEFKLKSERIRHGNDL